MNIYTTKKSAEDAKKADGYNAGDMIVKVPGGYTIMYVREYINWLVNQ